MDITTILTIVGVTVAVFGFLWTVYVYFIPKRANKPKLEIYSFQKDNDIGMWVTNKSEYNVNVFMIVLEIQDRPGCAILYLNRLNDEKYTISPGEVAYILTKMHPKQKSWIRDMAEKQSVVSGIVRIRDGNGITHTGNPCEFSIYAED